MLFSSMVFLWIFLPVTLVCSLALGPQRSNLFLLAASLLFYAWGEPVYVLLMLLSIAVNYSAGRLLGIVPEGRRKLVLIADIALNLLVFVHFKYLGLLCDIANRALSLVHVDFALTAPTIALPIGISFFTFQALSYVVDVYRKEVEPQRSLTKLALYISFFPQLIAGPIVRYKDVSEQIDRRRVATDGLAEGIRRFIYGLSKKVLLSNVLAQAVDGIHALAPEHITGAMAWMAAILYTLQIYYDFSGYSDMAIGLGRMFGFTFRENFNLPYMSRSIREFWRRWHISLSTWFREYVYIPLGGNRRGTARTYLNLFAVFFLTGLWHGAGYSFILWGLYHGMLSVIERLRFGRFLDKHRRFGLVYTFLAVVIGWVLFRAETLPLACELLARMATPWRFMESAYMLGEFVTPHTWLVLFCALAGMGPLQALCGEKLRRLRFSLPEVLVLGALLLLCFMALASSTYNPFIYFRF